MESSQIVTSQSAHFENVVCPAEYTGSGKSVFLAGGITGCPDWQADLTAMISSNPLAALNPRRENFPINDPTASDFQIKWEYRHLKNADAVSFWFPKETVCPITLFELGVQTMGTKKIFIGLDQDYTKSQEVYAITSIHRPEIEIVRSINELAQQVSSWANSTEQSSGFKLYPPPAPGTVFLAGGITGCPDWYTGLSKTVSDSGLTVTSERQKDFVKDANYHEKLVENHRDMLRSETIVFWFPKESINPIVLYELGIAVMTGKNILVGVEPGYCREIDVIIQTGLARPNVKVVNSVDELAEQIIK